MIKGKRKIYLDADDTIMNSSLAIIEIANQKFGTDKTIDDLKDWSYETIFKNTDEFNTVSLYESDIFFETVTPNIGFCKFYEKYKNELDFIVVTLGTKKNLEKKKEWFKKIFPAITFFGIGIGEGSAFDKSILDMYNSIQIDDRFDCVRYTNASVKMVLKNNKDFYWANQTDITNFYYMDNWDMIDESVDFILHNQYLFFED